MPNNPTEFSEQKLENYAADTSVDPPIRRTGLLAKESGSYYGVTGRTAGSTFSIDMALVDASGNQITSFGGGTQYTEGDTDTTITGNALMFESNTGTNAISAVSPDAPLPVDLGVNNDVTLATLPDTASGDLAAINASTDGIEGLLATIDADTGSIANSVSTTATNTDALGAKIDNRSTATDTTSTSAISLLKQISYMLQNPASRAVTNAGTFATQATLQTGSNTIGKLAANSGVDIGDVDVTSLPALAAGTNAIGKLAANSGVDIGDVTINNASGSPVYSHEDQSGITSERVSNTNGTSTAFTNFGATASTYNYIRAITVYNSSATAGYVDFRDGTSGTVLWTIPLPAGGGATLALDAPIFRTSANTALAYDVSGALSTVYISVSGYRSTT